MNLIDLVPPLLFLCVFSLFFSFAFSFFFPIPFSILIFFPSFAFRFLFLILFTVSSPFLHLFLFPPISLFSRFPPALCSFSQPSSLPPDGTLFSLPLSCVSSLKHFRAIFSLRFRFHPLPFPSQPVLPPAEDGRRPRPPNPCRGPPGAAHGAEASLGGVPRPRRIPGVLVPPLQDLAVQRLHYRGPPAGLLFRRVHEGGARGLSERGTPRRRAAGAPPRAHALPQGEVYRVEHR